MFGSRLYGKVYTFSIISPNATDKARQGRLRQRHDGPYVTPPSPDEEKRLNFRLKELLDYAARIMALDDKDGSRKWRGIEGLMKRMQHDFPYLIDEGTSLYLCYEDTIHGLTTEHEGPLSYSLFIDALGSKDKLDHYLNYVLSQGEAVGSGDQQRPLLRAEVMLLMLYSALGLELKHRDEFDSFFDDDSTEAPADNVVPMPHFGMENSIRAQQRWETAYEWLANNGYLRRNEVDFHGWVYTCCGQQKAPDGPIVWYGSTAALAHIVRSKFEGQWEIATRVFCLPKGKILPVSFKNTHRPVDKVANAIDRAFQSANSH